MANVLHRWWYATVFAAMAVVIAVTLLFHVKQSHGQTVLTPIQSQASITNSATMAAFPANPSRRAFTICNGSSTVTITITFGTALTPVSLTTGLVLLTNSGANINCYTSPAAITAGVGAQINAIGSGAGPSIVTLLEY